MALFRRSRAWLTGVVKDVPADATVRGVAQWSHPPHALIVAYVELKENDARTLFVWQGFTAAGYNIVGRYKPTSLAVYSSKFYTQVHNVLPPYPFTVMEFAEEVVGEMPLDWKP